ncbi:MAG: GspH/FimT family pseudopilin [Proteobacteria bacterium]|nr:GspH/FimT family pseudopilin [Pseudomonadota bacterium]
MIKETREEVRRQKSEVRGQKVYNSPLSALRSPLNHKGFTLIELITILVILGITAAVAVVRMSGTGAYDLASQVEVVKGHLRYAQTRAMNSNQVWGINFDSTTTYYLFQGAGSTTAVQLPGEDSTTISLTAKKSGLTITSAAQRITFNEFGSPFLDAATASSTITITTNGATITVTQNTGFIP